MTEAAVLFGAAGLGGLVTVAVQNLWEYLNHKRRAKKLRRRLVAEIKAKQKSVKKLIDWAEKGSEPLLVDVRSDAWDAASFEYIRREVDVDKSAACIWYFSALKELQWVLDAFAIQLGTNGLPGSASEAGLNYDDWLKVQRRVLLDAQEVEDLGVALLEELS